MRQKQGGGRVGAIDQQGTRHLYPAQGRTARCAAETGRAPPASARPESPPVPVGRCARPPGAARERVRKPADTCATPRAAADGRMGTVDRPGAEYYSFDEPDYFTAGLKETRHEQNAERSLRTVIDLRHRRLRIACRRVVRRQRAHRSQPRASRRPGQLRPHHQLAAYSGGPTVPDPGGLGLCPLGTCCQRRRILDRFRRWPHLHVHPAFRPDLVRRAPGDGK